MKQRFTTQGVHLWLALWRTARALEAYAFKNITSLGLGLTDFAVLEALLHGEPMPVNTIGRKVLLTSGSITAAIDRLEKQELVERRNHPDDRRVRLVWLTSKGRALIAHAFKKHKSAMDHAMAALDDGDRAALMALLRRVRKSLED